MTASASAVALAILSWVMMDITLLFALAGAANLGDPMDPPYGNRLLACLAVTTVFLGVNAIAIDNLGRHFGF